MIGCTSITKRFRLKMPELGDPDEKVYAVICPSAIAKFSWIVVTDLDENYHVYIRARAITAKTPNLRKFCTPIEGRELWHDPYNMVGWSFHCDLNEDVYIGLIDQVARETEVEEEENYWK
jgi:hypothetical protein